LKLSNNTNTRKKCKWKRKASKNFHSSIFLFLSWYFFLFF